MTERENDLAPLFKHFGEKKLDYLELSRDADAKAASERWPVLKNIPLQARTHLPVLSDEQRQDRIGSIEESTEEIELPIASAKTKLGSALNRLGDLRRTEVVRASTTLVDKATHLSESPPSPPASREHTDPRPENQDHYLFKPQHAGKVEPLSTPSHNEPERKRSGIFARKPTSPDPLDVGVKPEEKSLGIFGKKFSSEPAEHFQQPKEPEKRHLGLFSQRTAPVQHMEVRPELEKKNSGIFGKKTALTQPEPRTESRRGIWGRFNDINRPSAPRNDTVKSVSESGGVGLFGRRKQL